MRDILFLKAAIKLYIKGVPAKMHNVYVCFHYILVSELHIFLVSNPHNLRFIMYGRHKNFEDLMLLS